MRQPLRAAMSDSNSVTCGQCLDSLGKTTKRSIREPELFEVSQCVLEIITARAVAANGTKDHSRLLVERKPAHVIRAASERGERKSLPRAFCRVYQQQPRCVDQAAAHLPMPYSVERICWQSKRCTAAGSAAIEPERQSGTRRSAAVIVGIKAEAAVIATQQGRFRRSITQPGIPEQ